jgi:DNA adenine methylase Dam
MQYIKSPLNYIGNKYRIIDQIQGWFPKDIGTMVDLFCGGCDVTINTKSNRHIANDINLYLIQIFEEFQKSKIEQTLEYIDRTIEKWNLSKDNEQAYLDFRKYYNSTKEPLDLYILMCYSFNYQFRFNAAHEYNNPFGRARSSFNDVMRENLIKMVSQIQTVEFTSVDFLNFDYSVLKAGDFLYADPPYLIACGSYNDGKRGFRGWREEDELALYEILDELNDRGVKFALSNVSSHKGTNNQILLDWKDKNQYYLHHVDFNYNNCNYHSKNKENRTDEVLITNY